ncbi:hypothetical protein PAHAL_9G091500 [Panicum hallii]|uniref:Uncharacterized protein n=1 Tax=Panicum hallii TaxID=206008 RepID=A0A2T8I0N9_9POAL|nr:hypothetical protein PAHAL_9G091500 [Panicum hallii]
MSDCTIGNCNKALIGPEPTVLSTKSMMLFFSCASVVQSPRGFPREATTCRMPATIIDVYVVVVDVFKTTIAIARRAID